MGLKVIGAGFGRTGTMSMKMALEQLGLGRCHHMEEVFENPETLQKWRAAVDTGEADWADLTAGYDCTVDWPSCHFWRQLYTANPGAKVILTTRPVDDWWESYSNTIMKFMQIALVEDVPAVARGGSEMCVEMIGRQTFGADYTNEAAGKAAFLKRIEDVKAAIPAADLLIHEVGAGWGPLCDFLALPVLDASFPQSNARDEFFKNFDPRGDADGAQP